MVMQVAFIGLIVNLVAAWLLTGHHENLNVRAALLHVIGDLLGSVAALISGLVIVMTGWSTIDPLLSIAIAALILVSAVRVLKEAVHALMEGVPPSLDQSEIGPALAALNRVVSVHDLHVWSLWLHCPHTWFSTTCSTGKRSCPGQDSYWNTSTAFTTSPYNPSAVFSGWTSQ